MKTNSMTFLLSVVVGVGLAWFLIWPKAQDIDGLRSDVSRQREDLAILHQTEDSIRDNFDFYSGLRPEDIEPIELAVPSYSDEVNIVNILGDVAEQNGMVVNTITAVPQTSRTTSPSSFSTVQVDMQLQGSYLSFQEFVKSSEKILRIFDITGIGITSQIDQDLPAFSVSGNVYYSR